MDNITVELVIEEMIGIVESEGEDALTDDRIEACCKKHKLNVEEFNDLVANSMTAATELSSESLNEVVGGSRPGLRKAAAIAALLNVQNIFGASAMRATQTKINSVANDHVYAKRDAENDKDNNENDDSKSSGLASKIKTFLAGSASGILGVGILLAKLIASKSNEIADLKEQLAEAESNRDKINEELNQTTNPDELRSLQEKHERATKEIENLNKKIEAKEQEIEGLKRDQETAENSYKDAEESICNKDKEIEVLSKELKTKKEEIEKLQNAKQKLEDANNHADAEKTRAKIEELTEELQETRKKLEDANNHADVQKERAEETDKLWKAEQAKLAKQNDELTQKTKKIKELEKSQTNLKTRNAQLSANLEKQANTIKTRDAKIEGLQQRVEGLTAELEKAKHTDTFTKPGDPKREPPKLASDLSKKDPPAAPVKSDAKPPFVPPAPGQKPPPAQVPAPKQQNQMQQKTQNQNPLVAQSASTQTFVPPPLIGTTNQHNGTQNLQTVPQQQAPQPKVQQQQNQIQQKTQMQNPTSTAAPAAKQQQAPQPKVQQQQPNLVPPPAQVPAKPPPDQHPSAAMSVASQQSATPYYIPGLGYLVTTPHDSHTKPEPYLASPPDACQSPWGIYAYNCLLLDEAIFYSNTGKSLSGPFCLNFANGNKGNNGKIQLPLTAYVLTNADASPPEYTSKSAQRPTARYTHRSARCIGVANDSKLISLKKEDLSKVSTKITTPPLYLSNDIFLSNTPSLDILNKAPDLWHLKDSTSPACVVNFGNASLPGGGSWRGIPSQEQNLCVATNLLPKLCSHKAAVDYYTTNASVIKPVLNFGNDFTTRSDYDRYTTCIFTPNVKQIKGSISPRLNEFLPTEEQTLLHVITIAAPMFTTDCAKNLTPDSKDYGTYLELCKNQWRCILYTAHSEKMKSIVLGALGCGKFNGNPAIVSRALCEVLKDEGPDEKTPWINCFTTIIVSILTQDRDNDLNYTEFKANLRKHFPISF